MQSIEAERAILIEIKLNVFALYSICFKFCQINKINKYREQFHVSFLHLKSLK